MNENLYFAFCHLSILDKNYILKHKKFYFFTCALVYILIEIYYCTLSMLYFQYNYITLKIFKYQWNKKYVNIDCIIF